MAGCGVHRSRTFSFCLAVSILLAATLHLLEYLPAFPWASGNWSPVPVFAQCQTHLYDLNWKVNRSEMAAADHAAWSWAGSSPPEPCHFQRMGRDDVTELLRGKRVLVAGDSQARLFLLALLELQVPNVDAIRPDLFKRHSGYKFVWEPEEIVFDFVWAPYVANITNALKDASNQGVLPDLIVLGAGLWDMLHITNDTDYVQGLSELREAITATRQSVALMKSGAVETQDVPHVFWVNIPTLIPHLLNTEAKRTRMTTKKCWAYNEAVQRSRILYPEGPAMLIDMRNLSSRCGEECTADGMHYNDAVYQAAAQIALNALKMSAAWYRGYT